MRTKTLMLAIFAAGCITGGSKPLDTGGTAEDTGDIIDDPGDITEICEERADEIREETFRVVFEPLSDGCPWGEGDNLQPRQGYVTARVEQVRALELEDAIMCDMGFAFAGEAGLEQDIIYDDNFIFLFNGVVMASSYRPWILQLEQEGIFRIYDWSRIAGLENLFDSSIPTYCLGDETDQADCDIPPPETQGPIRLSFALSLSQELSFMAIEENRVEFTFIATGDNDRTDCSHDGFYLDLGVSYLPR